MEIETSYLKFVRNMTPEGYKLLCFPYAGGGASFYAGWQQYMPEVEILPVQLPGRENRMGEPLFRELGSAVEAITEAVFPIIEKSEFSIFGHSMGGILGYETAKSLESLGAGPQLCFISATSVDERPKDVLSSELSEDDFFLRVSEYGAIDETSEILEYPEFREIFMKVLRADFGIIESYKKTETILHCPVVTLCGDEDPMMTIARMDSWKNFAERIWMRREFTGGHFYINDHREELCKLLKDTIKNFGRNK